MEMFYNYHFFSFQLTDDISVVRNTAPLNEVSGRSDGDFFDNVESYIRSHDVTFKLPIVGGAVTVQPRNLDQAEFNLNIKLNDGSEESNETGVNGRCKYLRLSCII